MSRNYINEQSFGYLIHGAKDDLAKAARRAKADACPAAFRKYVMGIKGYAHAQVIALHLPSERARKAAEKEIGRVSRQIANVERVVSQCVLPDRSKTVVMFPAHWSKERREAALGPRDVEYKKGW